MPLNKPNLYKTSHEYKKKKDDFIPKPHVTKSNRS